MSLIRDKLTSYKEELETIYDNVSWYASANKLDNIDDSQVILSFTINNNKADGVIHFSRVSLLVYVSNGDEHSEDLRQLGYELDTETELDEQINTYQMYTRDVIIL